MPEHHNEQAALAVLHGYDPATDRTSTDAFRERDEDAGQTSPWHRAVALRDSVQGDFPGWVWSIGINDRARNLMADENMRRWLGSEYVDTRVCSTPECPGDGRYAAPGKGHRSECPHLRIRPDMPHTTATDDGATT